MKKAEKLEDEANRGPVRRGRPRKQENEAKAKEEEM